MWHFCLSYSLHCKSVLPALAYAAATPIQKQPGCQKTILSILFCNVFGLRFINHFAAFAAYKVFEFNPSPNTPHKSPPM
jgi:hypothetical protein